MKSLFHVYSYNLGLRALTGLPLVPGWKVDLIP